MPVYNTEENKALLADEETELKRQQALYKYSILDTNAEREFDDLAALASFICNTPIVLISFITHDRQWFKARRGMLAP